MTEQEKEIDHIEILHLDETGYGPQGKHTRRQWRAECLENLLAGKEQFEAWQKSWIDQTQFRSSQDYSYKVKCFDGQHIELNLNTISFTSKVTLDFIGVEFASYVDAKSFNFFLDAYFNDARFIVGAYFVEAIFHKRAFFKAAKFEGISTFFYDTNFHGTASFEDTTFSNCVSFKTTKFFDNCYFSRSNFEYSEFDYAEFTEDVYFADATFNSTTSFSRATFLKYGIFTRTKFNQKADFFRANFKNRALFIAANFNEIANFENAQLHHIGEFERAVFKKSFPSFLGCKSDMTHLYFSSDKNHFPRSAASEEDIKNVSFLKRLSDEHGQTEQALNFNAMELRAKRLYEHKQLNPKNHPDSQYERLTQHLSWRLWVRFTSLFKEKRWFIIVTLLYEYVSDFGRSFIRPFVALLVLNIVTVLICLCFAYNNTPATDMASNQNLGVIEKLDAPSNRQGYYPISGWRAATEYSLYRTGNFLDFSDADKRTEMINQRLFQSDIEPTSMRIYGFFKGLCSAFLIFLFALGLRNKYRVG